MGHTFVMDRLLWREFNLHHLPEGSERAIICHVTGRRKSGPFSLPAFGYAILFSTTSRIEVIALAASFSNEVWLTWLKGSKFHRRKNALLPRSRQPSLLLLEVSRGHPFLSLSCLSVHVANECHLRSKLLKQLVQSFSTVALFTYYNYTNQAAYQNE